MTGTAADSADHEAALECVWNAVAAAGLPVLLFGPVVIQLDWLMSSIGHRPKGDCHARNHHQGPLEAEAEGPRIR